LPVAIVEGDDFYSDISDDERAALSPADGFEQYFDWRRLKSQILEPLREGNAALRYQQYDWQRATMGNWVQTKQPAVVIVEGMYTLRPQLRELFDVRVYVRTSDELRAQRQMHRSENSNEWIARWAAAEEYYESRFEPWRNVDFTVDGG
jgi:phosphoribulokinase